MPCPKCSDTLKRCPDVQSSDCIKYVGDSNTCLDFCKGQSISEVIEQLGTETCTIKENTDVSNISLLDYCSEIRNSYISKGYTETNVKNFIDFLISFDCVLQGQINTINNNLTTFSPTVKANWNCLSNSPCITEGTVNLNTAIQNLINVFCTQQDALVAQGLQLADTINQLNNLQTKYTCLLNKVTEMDTQLNTLVGDYVSVNPNSCSL